MKKLSERKKKWIERTVANDRSYKLYLYNRFFIFALLVLAQVVGYVVLLYAFAYDSKIGYAIQMAVGVLEIIFVLTIINRYDRPSTKLNWILLIVLVPIVGVPMYLLYGDGQQTRRMRKKIEKAKAQNQKQFVELYGESKEFIPQTRDEAVSRYLTSYTSYRVYTDGTVEYYKCGEELFPAMLEELKKAEKFILLEYFIIAGGKMWDSILEILLEKAMQGVQVRIIYDDFGCMMTLPPDYDAYLESLHKNIKCLSFNTVVPVFTLRMNNRDHRKIMVIDGKVAFTGGVNLADEYIAEKERFGYWKDSGVKVTGEATRSFTMMFFYLWNAFRKDKEQLNAYLLPPSEVKTEIETVETFQGKTRKYIHPYDNSPLGKQSVGATVYLDLIQRANKYVYIFTPYLILDDEMRAALIHAAMRGVDVRIVTPGIPDKKMVYRLTRANYDILMRMGVKIYEYTPGFIHSKSMVCDDECAVVGTINFDYRSLYLHFENAVYFSGCDAVMDVKRDCEETFAVSKLCTKENYKRGFFGRLVDALLRLFETMF